VRSLSFRNSEWLQKCSSCSVCGLSVRNPECLQWYSSCSVSTQLLKSPVSIWYWRQWKFWEECRALKEVIVKGGVQILDF